MLDQLMTEIPPGMKFEEWDAGMPVGKEILAANGAAEKLENLDDLLKRFPVEEQEEINSGAEAFAEQIRQARANAVPLLIRVAVLAGVVFEDQQRAFAWLSNPQIGLGNRIPLELLDTEVGAQVVHDLLGRIERGVFS